MFLLALLLCLSLGLFMGFLPKLAQKYLFFANLYRNIKFFVPFCPFPAILGDNPTGQFPEASGLAEV